MMPEDVDLSNVTPGFVAGAGSVEVAVGQSVVHGDVEFTCAAGSRDCEVMLMGERERRDHRHFDRRHGHCHERRCIQHANSAHGALFGRRVAGGDPVVTRAKS